MLFVPLMSTSACVDRFLGDGDTSGGGRDAGPAGNAAGSAQGGSSPVTVAGSNGLPEAGSVAAGGSDGSGAGEVGACTPTPAEQLTRVLSEEAEGMGATSVHSTWSQSATSVVVTPASAVVTTPSGGLTAVCDAVPLSLDVTVDMAEDPDIMGFSETLLHPGAGALRMHLSEYAMYELGHVETADHDFDVGASHCVAVTGGIRSASVCGIGADTWTEWVEGQDEFRVFGYVNEGACAWFSGCEVTEYGWHFVADEYQACRAATIASGPIDIVELDDRKWWTSLEVRGAGSIRYQVLDGDGQPLPDSVVPGNGAGLTDSLTRLFGLSAADYPTLFLRAETFAQAQFDSFVVTAADDYSWDFSDDGDPEGWVGAQPGEEVDLAWCDPIARLPVDAQAGALTTRAVCTPGQTAVNSHEIQRVFAPPLATSGFQRVEVRVRSDYVAFAPSSVALTFNRLDPPMDGPSASRPTLTASLAPTREFQTVQFDLSAAPATIESLTLEVAPLVDECGAAVRTSAGPALAGELLDACLDETSSLAECLEEGPYSAVEGFLVDWIRLQ